MVRISRAERERVRERLLKSAAEHFAAHGFDQANIDAIALDAGYAKGTIYNYFASKLDLMIALIEEAARDHFSHIADRVLEEKETDRRMERFFEAGYSFVAGNLASARVLFNTIHGPHSELREIIQEAYQPLFELVGKEIVGPGIAKGRYRQTDPRAATGMIMMILLGTTAQVGDEGRFVIGPEQVAAFVERGLG